MRFTEWLARNTAFVCLATRNEVSHAARQLFITINQIAYVGGHESTVEASHVHLPVIMERHRTRQRA